VPTGTIVPTALPTGTSVAGWLECNGTAVSRVTYATLFGYIGTTFGAGNGSTTFNLPDLRGRIPMGAGTGAGEKSSGTGTPTGTPLTARTVGQWGGREGHQLTTAEIPSHSHSYPFNVSGGGGGGSTPSNAGSGGAVSTSNGGGNDGEHTNVQPFLVLTYLIKT